MTEFAAKLAEKRAAQQAVEAEGVEPFYIDNGGSGGRTGALDAIGYLRALWPSVKTARVLQYDEDRPTIALELEDGRTVALGTLQQLTSTTAAGKIVGALTFATGGVGRIVIPRGAMPEILRALAAAAEKVTNSTEEDATIALLAHFAERGEWHAPGGGYDLDDADDRKTIIDGQPPFFWTKDGRLWLLRHALETHLRRHLHLTVDAADLRRRMHALGFEPPNDRNRVQQAGYGKSRRYWKSPPGFDERIDDAA